MRLKNTIKLLFVLTAINSYSQEKSVIIQGKIYSGNNPVSDVHILNVSKKIGTISNDLGKFELLVTKNDTLYVSSLQYKKITVLVTGKNIDIKKINIELVPFVNELDEVFLKQLSGNLLTDIVSQPKNTAPAMGSVYTKSDLKKNLPSETFDVKNRPNAQNLTDPIKMSGGGATLPDRRYQKSLKLKRELKQKKEFPEKIKKEFGIDFFTVNLNIPEDQINRFISYCEYYNIIEKYYNNKVLEVIEILKKESITYNAIKK